MVKEVTLNETLIKINEYKEDQVNGLNRISINFKVSSDDYHEITTLLYQGTFEVSVPERRLNFKGTIQQYSTSFTNLYVRGQVGDFHLSLLEVKN